MIDITFDRSEKLYKWTDPQTGEVITAPAKCRGDLFRAAVGMLDPDLYAAAGRMIAKNPQLERVAWRAVELIVGDGVEILAGAPGGVWAMVASSDGYGRYAITSDESGFDVCQCEHYATFAAPMTATGRRVCKHIAAARLYLATREDRF